MFCVTPNLLCGPTLRLVRLIRHCIGPQNTFGGGEGGSFDIGCPSFTEERRGDVGEGFAFGGDENRAENVVRVFQVLAWEMINAGCSWNQHLDKNKMDHL